MKSTGHCLITSSTTFHSVFLKTCGRLSTDFFYFLCNTLYAYQNSKLHSASLVGCFEDRFLAYGPEQHPIVLQIGGNNLKNLSKATQLATPYVHDEIVDVLAPE